MIRRPVLAVFGGSFDPPHIGHVLIPTYLLTRGLASQVLVAPCWSHPFAKRMSPFLERLAWTRLAMAVHGPQVAVSDLELRLAEARDAGTPSYSYELLKAVAAAYPAFQVRLRRFRYLPQRFVLNEKSSKFLWIIVIDATVHRSRKPDSALTSEWEIIQHQHPARFRWSPAVRWPVLSFRE